MPEQQHKCGGYCCERFIINMSPNEMKEEYLAWLALSGPGNYTHMKKYTSKGARPELRSYNLSVRQDIHLVYPMLIYLGKHDWEPAHPEVKSELKSHHYTCKHFDKESRLCTIYDIRPAMCKIHPVRGYCEFPGCEIPGNEERKSAIKEDENKVLETCSVQELQETKNENT